jgi:hypothetical protein
MFHTRGRRYVLYDGRQGLAHRNENLLLFGEFWHGFSCRADQGSGNCKGEEFPKLTSLARTASWAL